MNYSQVMAVYNSKKCSSADVRKGHGQRCFIQKGMWDLAGHIMLRGPLGRGAHHVGAAPIGDEKAVMELLAGYDLAPKYYPPVELS